MGEFYDFAGDVLDAASAAMEFKLVVPETARRSKKDATMFFWSEAGVVTAAAQSKKEEDDKTKTQVLTFTVSISQEGSGKNVGKPLTTFMRVNQKALRDGAPKNRVTMSNMALAKLRELFNAVGVEADLDGGGYSQNLIATYFPPESEFPGEPSELIGRVLYFEVKQGKRTYNGQEKEQAEITKILMPSEG